MGNDIIAIIIICVILAIAIIYILIAKKNGSKCIGCPHSKRCGSSGNCCCKDNKE